MNIINGESLKYLIKLTYPIMTGQHEVVSPGGPVPERVPGGDDAHIVGDKLPERGDVVGEGPIHVFHHKRDAEWQEVDVRFLSIHRPEPIPGMLDLVYEPTLSRV